MELSTGKVAPINVAVKLIDIFTHKDLQDAGALFTTKYTTLPCEMPTTKEVIIHKFSIRSGFVQFSKHRTSPIIKNTAKVPKKAVT